MHRRLLIVRTGSRLTTMAATAVVALSVCSIATAQDCPGGGGGGGGIPGLGGGGIPGLGGGGFGGPGGGLQQAFVQSQLEAMIRQQAMQEMAVRQMAAEQMQRQAAILQEAQRQQAECNGSQGNRSRRSRVARSADAPQTGRERQVEGLKQRQREREEALQARIAARNAELETRRARAARRR